MCRHHDSPRVLGLVTAVALVFVWPSMVSGLEKWSRQVDSTEPGVNESFDWIPLTQTSEATTKDRSANARVLTYSQSFPPQGPFRDLPRTINNAASASAAHKSTHFDHPFAQYQRFGNAPQAQALRQSNPLNKHTNVQLQAPTSQTFFKFEMPYNGDSGRLGNLATAVNSGFQVQHAFGNGAQAAYFTSPVYNQQAVFPSEFHPLPGKPVAQPLKQKNFNQHNFLGDSLNLHNDYNGNQKAVVTQSPLHTITPQVFQQHTQQQTQGLLQPFNKRGSLQFKPLPASLAPTQAPNLQLEGNVPQQEVQYLYVPYESLYNRPSAQEQQQQPYQFEDINKFNTNFIIPTVNPYQVNQFYTPESAALLDANLFTASTTTKPISTTFKPSSLYQSFDTFQTTTLKPKPKAHQPPLAMFLLRSPSSRAKPSDVVDILHSAKHIAVVDAPTHVTPTIFVGPAGMLTPPGYVKFDLPYLSQLHGTHNLQDIPFFVAPLSYRTPNGFNKILLPEPHVGSIVINLAKGNAMYAITERPVSNLFNYPQQMNYFEYSTTTARPRETLPPTTQTTNRGNKFTYFYDPESVDQMLNKLNSKERLHQKDRKKTQPNQSQSEHFSSVKQQSGNLYNQFNPIPNQISGFNYFQLNTNKPGTTTSSTTPTPTTTTSTTTTTTSTSTTQGPQSYFVYNTSPLVEYPSSSGHLYPQENPIVQDIQKTHLTTRPSLTAGITPEEEYRMKHYYRQQDAFRNRPKIVSASKPTIEQEHYTPINLDYELKLKPQTIAPTTNSKITFYSPSQAGETNESAKAPNSETEVQSNSNSAVNHRLTYSQNEVTDDTVEYDPNPYQLPSELPQLTANLPGLVNNLQEKNKQIPVFEQQVSATIAPKYEEEHSSRPTRRPNRIRKPTTAKTNLLDGYSDDDLPNKRTQQKVRRPFGTRYGGHNDENDIMASTSALRTAGGATTTTTTKRPFNTRKPFVRNPNRIRYQPTPEERETLRLKTKKKHYKNNHRAEENEDLDYQRDVLKQNYPVFRPITRRPLLATPTASSYIDATTEAPAAETQQIYTVTPSNNLENDNRFPISMFEPMQIAQQQSQFKDNYGPGYFPNQEDVSPTEAALRNEINSVYTTTPELIPKTTTTEATTTTTTTKTTTTSAPTTETATAEVITKRGPFFRRNQSKLRISNSNTNLASTTTTEIPVTTTTIATPAEDKPSIRHRTPPTRRIVKLRARTRRPLYSTTTLPSTQEDYTQANDESKKSYRKVNRFNPDAADQEALRRRYKSRFQLEAQESQWSPSIKAVPAVGSLKFPSPNDPVQDDGKNKGLVVMDAEPDIVTADPNNQQYDDFEINLSATYGSAAANDQVFHPTVHPTIRSDKSFAELLEEVMGKSPEEKLLQTERTKQNISNEQSPVIRRGKWKKVRVTPISLSTSINNLEAVATENVHPQSFSSLPSQEHTIAPETNKQVTQAIPLYTTINPYIQLAGATESSSIDRQDVGVTTDMQDSIVTTISNDAEVTTRMNAEGEKSNQSPRAADRVDDLEIQPSLFSEVKRQLHELFSIEESDDSAVNAALSTVGKKRQEYRQIVRNKGDAITTTTATTSNLPTTTILPTLQTILASAEKQAFHKQLMEHVIYATSQPKTDETSDAEICYRGRCIKSDDLPHNHKLN